MEKVTTLEPNGGKGTATVPSENTAGKVLGARVQKTRILVRAPAWWHMTICNCASGAVS